MKATVESAMSWELERINTCETLKKPLHGVGAALLSTGSPPLGVDAKNDR
jgi:hypothetical protein